MTSHSCSTDSATGIYSKSLGGMPIQLVSDVESVQAGSGNAKPNTSKTHIDDSAKMTPGKLEPTTEEIPLSPAPRLDPVFDTLVDSVLSVGGALDVIYSMETTVLRCSQPVFSGAGHSSQGLSLDDAEVLVKLLGAMAFSLTPSALPCSNEEKQEAAKSGRLLSAITSDDGMDSGAPSNSKTPQTDPP
ncbi:uncharacterized protein EMH_0041610 [Eimeria mitis]|uniref:Uncharacterized protein n=1 Tax=Eimeria mitis TaxID=44415 RepID=U6JWU1_9EIME|nr:uncharacterized protein EMH_0041610 [Eimeria mitis]CDJ28522.1 hypothetical protein EMH_0041610 [Eimeria mitis]